MSDKDPDNVERVELKGHKIDSDGQYVWIKVKGGGQVQITFDDEGVVVDFWDSHDQNINTMASEYSEFNADGDAD